MLLFDSVVLGKTLRFVIGESARVEMSFRGGPGEDKGTCVHSLVNTTAVTDRRTPGAPLPKAVWPSPSHGKSLFLWLVDSVCCFPITVTMINT